MIRHFNAGDWNRAAQMFAHGIEQAPSFSPLYSSLAQMNNAVHFVQPGMFRDPAKSRARWRWRRRLWRSIRWIRARNFAWAGRWR